MKAEQVNSEVASVMGLKSKKILGTRVRRHCETGEYYVTIDAIATEKQTLKLKELLIRNLQEE